MIKPKPAGGGWATVEIKIAPARAIQRNVYLYRIYIYIYMHDYLQEIVITSMRNFWKNNFTFWEMHIFARVTRWRV